MPWSRIRPLDLAVLVVVASLALFGTPSAWARDTPQSADGRVWPVDGGVLRRFDPPDQRWNSGHRGLDLVGTAGQSVLASASGQVSWVGVIDGVASVSVSHPDGLRTTYQPVTATVSTGSTVIAGDPIGRLGEGHCFPGDCLHLGLKRGDGYLDPLPWLLSGSPVGEVRLLPTQATVTPLNIPSTPLSVRMAQGVGSLPVNGTVTSGFGWRHHPVLGIDGFHGGVDIGSACLSPVHSPWPGTVISVASNSAAGNKVVIDHGMVGGRTVQTSYHHLADTGRGLSVVGQRVMTGQVVGLVGTTGLSTGCHLHFAASVDGAPADPATLVEK